MRAATDGNIPRAAAALSIEIADHATVVARARAALARIDERLREARRSGAVPPFTVRIASGGSRRQRKAAAS
jgi:hypothetical protein